MAKKRLFDVETTSSPHLIPERKKRDAKGVETKLPWKPGMQPVLVRMLKRSKRHVVGDVCAIPQSVAAGYVKSASAEYVKPKPAPK